MAMQANDHQKPVQPLIILVDRDAVYRSRVARRLASILNVSVAGLDPQGNLVSELENQSGQGQMIVLADPASCRLIAAETQLAARLQLFEWLENPPEHRGQLGINGPTGDTGQTGTAGQPGAAVQPSRLMPINQLASWLSLRLPERLPEAICPDQTKDVSASAAQAPAQPDLIHPEVSRFKGLLLTLDLGWTGHREWVRQQIRQQLAAGDHVTYLPLMPTYRMELLHSPGRGPNLTALILRLANGEDLNPSDLGLYIEPHPDGFWQFRPPERADDLVLASLPALHELVSLLRRKVHPEQPAGLPDGEKGPDPDSEKQSKSMGENQLPDQLAILDCSGLPLRTATALAVMVDALAVRFEPGQSWAIANGQRELSAVLAKLPATCKIIEMTPPTPK